MCPVTRATRATPAVLAPRLARGVGDVATRVQQRRRDAQSGIDPIRTPGRHLGRGLVQDADLPLLLCRVRELLSAGEDIHPLFPALVLRRRDGTRLAKILVRHHILALARLLIVELPEDEAIPAHSHPLLVGTQRGTEAIPAHQHHLVDAGTVILAHQRALFLVRALHHSEEQVQDVDAPHRDLPLVLLRDEQDPRSETNVACVATHHLQKHLDLDRPLVVNAELAMLLLAALNPRLRAPRWTLATSIPAVGVY